MCYLCKPTPRGKVIAKAIDEALRVWRSKEGTHKTHKSWGRFHDWTKPPAKPARLPERPDVPQGDGLWTEAELRERLP